MRSAYLENAELTRVTIEQGKARSSHLFVELSKALAGDPATLRGRYEMDYWGLSYKQGIDHILATDPRLKITIAVANKPGEFFIEGGLTPAEQARLILVADPGQADYFVTDFRWHPANYSGWPEVYSARVRGVEIMAVYKMR